MLQVLNCFMLPRKEQWNKSFSWLTADPDQSEPLESFMYIGIHYVLRYCSTHRCTIVIDYIRGNWVLVMTFMLLLFWISGVFTGAAYSALKIPDPEPTPLILQSFIKMKNHSLFLGMWYTLYTLHVLLVMIIFDSSPWHPGSHSYDWLAGLFFSYRKCSNLGSSLHYYQVNSAYRELYSEAFSDIKIPRLPRLTTYYLGLCQDFCSIMF